MRPASVIEGGRSLPVPEPDLTYLRQVRRGEVSLDEVIAAVDDAEARLSALHDSPDVPPQPDRAWVDDWLHRRHLAYWGECLSPSNPWAALKSRHP